MLTTLKVKLLTTPEQQAQLLEAMETFNTACQYISDWCFAKQIFAKYEIHKHLYTEVREKFKMKSQMVVRAVGKVAESYTDKAKRKSKHNFDKRGAMIYDTRLLTIKKFDEVSICTLHGRIRVNMTFGGYRDLDLRRVRGQADLCWDKTNKAFYLFIVVEQPEAELNIVDKYIGVDLGIVNIATDSTGTTYSGKEIKKIQSKTSNLKSKLQAVESHSSKKHLKKLAKKENRQKTNYNHKISKQLVMKAKALGVGIKLEDLTRFKRTVKPGAKALNRARATWAFAQLRTFIEYKAKIAGIPVMLVNPAYSSQTCSSCGHCCKENRLTQSDFCCQKCGYSANADYNAAVNISRGISTTPSSSEVLLTKVNKTVTVLRKFVRQTARSLA